eukprot:Nk52_evm1s314 gene=Nk52_evmTU1s314
MSDLIVNKRYGNKPAKRKFSELIFKASKYTPKCERSSLDAAADFPWPDAKQLCCPLTSSNIHNVNSNEKNGRPAKNVDQKRRTSFGSFTYAKSHCSTATWENLKTSDPSALLLEFKEGSATHSNSRSNHNNNYSTNNNNVVSPAMSSLDDNNDENASDHHANLLLRLQSTTTENIVPNINTSATNIQTCPTLGDTNDARQQSDDEHTKENIDKMVTKKSRTSIRNLDNVSKERGPLKNVTSEGNVPVSETGNSGQNTWFSGVRSRLTRNLKKCTPQLLALGHLLTKPTPSETVEKKQSEISELTEEYPATLTNEKNKGDADAEIQLSTPNSSQDKENGSTLATDIADVSAESEEGGFGSFCNANEEGGLGDAQKEGMEEEVAAPGLHSSKVSPLRGDSNSLVDELRGYLDSFMASHGRSYDAKECFNDLFVLIENLERERAKVLSSLGPLKKKFDKESPNYNSIVHVEKTVCEKYSRRIESVLSDLESAHDKLREKKIEHFPV